MLKLACQITLHFFYGLDQEGKKPEAAQGAKTNTPHADEFRGYRTYVGLSHALAYTPDINHSSADASRQE